MSDELFWADQIASSIINRKKFFYTDDKIKQPKEYTVKTSASLSGVLHIGRLSDTIRSESVYRALKDAGKKARLIWVAEDMDPFRKVPKGVPASYKKYLGMPVTDIPDPEGCHKSYADHHREEYLKVIHDFVSTKMKVYSTREEYLKGTFKPFIKKIVKQTELTRDIQNKFRKEKQLDWSPWRPICDKCGKLSTTKLTDVQDGLFHYVCQDYKFETTTATGCGHKGISDPMKGNGKLMWKSEWAAEWAMWNVVAEGAGKEYQVPGSAFWINGEIAEKVLKFPQPEPIFYEHLMIDNEKMSASLGNVIYPKDWIQVAPPEMLRMFYNKKIMKTRSFSWQDLPRMYDEFDDMARIQTGEKKLDNKKEIAHHKRLFAVTALDKPRVPLKMSFSHAMMVAQVFKKEKDIINVLEKTNHWKKEKKKEILERIKYAQKYLDTYVPDNQKFSVQEELPPNLQLEDKQKEALHRIADALHKESFNEESLYAEFFNICKDMELSPKELFQAGYKVLLNRERGPKLATLVISIGTEKVSKLFKTI